MRICIHMRANLCAAQPEFSNAPLEFACCQIGILHGNSGKTSEVLRIFSNDFGNVIV